MNLTLAMKIQVSAFSTFASTSLVSLRFRLTQATVRRELSTLAAALGYCHREGYLQSGPAVWLPPASAPRETYLSRQEVARLIRAARTDTRSSRHLSLFILVAYGTGRRKEAILSLQRAPNVHGGWVDLEKGMIDFRPVGRAETAKKRGRLRVPDRLLRFLRHACQRTKPHVFEYGPHNRRTKDLRGHTCPPQKQRASIPKWSRPMSCAIPASPTWYSPACRFSPPVAWVDVTMDTAERVYIHHDGRDDKVRDAWDKGGRGRK